MKPFSANRLLLPLVLAGAVLGSAVPLPAATDEYEVKAKILRILGGYVTWPPSGGRDAGGELVLGVVGASPFKHHLDRLAQGAPGPKRPIRIVYLETYNPADLKACDLLFICASESDRLPRLLALCKGRPIFTVGDSPGFAQRGAMLNLLVTEGTVRLEVNLKAAREAGLEISSAFLAIPKDKAKIVEGP